MKSNNKLGPIWLLATLLAFMVSACGAKAAPTIDPAQVQASAVAAANTIVAMTQAAMPTDTPVPPTAASTDTPQPTPTIPPLPTAPILASPTVASSSGGDCNGLIDRQKGEKSANFLVRNKSGQLITVSFYLEKNSFADCGYWATQISSGNSISVTSLPLGCYFISAISFGKPPFRVSSGKDICTGFNTDKFTVNITSQDPIVVIAP
ncbi:MAG TPA: hypothetical protein VLZ89_11600 [Anaerolineales bacterium]|nr:hypothetical protein [Anaerolineales bacterium]